MNGMLCFSSFLVLLSIECHVVRNISHCNEVSLKHLIYFLKTPSVVLWFKINKNVNVLYVRVEPWTGHIVLMFYILCKTAFLQTIMLKTGTQKQLFCRKIECTPLKKKFPWSQKYTWHSLQIINNPVYKHPIMSQLITYICMYKLCPLYSSPVLVFFIVS